MNASEEARSETPSSVSELARLASSDGPAAAAAVQGLREAARAGVQAADQAVAGLGDAARGTGPAARAAIEALEQIGRMGNRCTARAVEELGGLGRKGLPALETLGHLGIEQAAAIVERLDDALSDLAVHSPSVTAAAETVLAMALAGHTGALSRLRGLAANPATAPYASEMISDLLQHISQTDGLTSLATQARTEIAQGGQTETECPAWYLLGWLADLGHPAAATTLATILPPRL
jgi:hypothetical protein